MTDQQRIRHAVRDGRYVFSDHAVEEAQADHLNFSDIVSVLLQGEIDSVYTDDPRGERYVVRGDRAGDDLDVVCRFRGDEVLVIIPVYLVD